VEENTKRQITWLVFVGIVLILIITSVYRHRALHQARVTLQEGTAPQRVRVVKSLVATHKLATALEGQPRWVQDKALSAVASVGTPDALLQLIDSMPLLDKPVAGQASAYLVMMGDQAIGPLVEKMQGKDDGIRGATVGPLIQIGTPVVSSVIKLVGAYDDYVRNAVVGVLGGIGAPAAPPLIRLARRTEPLGEQTASAFVRAEDTVQRSLAAVKVPAIAPIIADLLTYKAPEVRARAAAILGQIIDQTSAFVRDIQTVIPIPMADARRTVGPLVERLNTDDSWMVRRQAALALGRLYDAGRKPVILQALLAHLSDPQPQAKAAAVEALGLIGDPAVAPAIVNTLLTNREGAEREIGIALPRLGIGSIAALAPAFDHPNSRVRRIAAQAMAEIGTTQAAVPLARWLTDPEPSIRRLAAEALIPIATPEVVPQLIAALADPDWKVYHAAQRALARMGAPAVEALIARLGSGDARISYMAEQALATIGEPAMPQLLVALHSPSEPERKWAAVTLGDIGPATVAPVTRVLTDPAASPAAKAAAARALGYSGVGLGIKPLVKAAGSPHEKVCIAALEAINDMRHPEGTSALVSS